MPPSVSVHRRARQPPCRRASANYPKRTNEAIRTGADGDAAADLIDEPSGTVRDVMLPIPCQDKIRGLENQAIGRDGEGATT